jgi:RNA methyltransferase, TrmH family
MRRGRPSVGYLSRSGVALPGGAGPRPRYMIIASLQNPRVKDLVRLRDRRGRERDQKLLIEGYRELLRAVAAGYPVDELYICPALFQGSNEPALIERCRAAGAQVFETTENVFGKVAYRDRPEGLIGVGPQVHRGLRDIALPGDRPALLLIAEAIEKPGNLGTMLRSADAAAVTGLIVCDSRTDLFNPNVVRASTGTLFTVPLAEAAPEETIAWLRAHGIRILAATPHAQARFTDADLTAPVAIVVGTEQYGLSPRWLEACDLPVRIPMLGIADSLNVATATALLLYEAVRQRLVAGLVADTAPT